MIIVEMIGIAIGTLAGNLMHQPKCMINKHRAVENTGTS